MKRISSGFETGRRRNDIANKLIASGGEIELGVRLDSPTLRRVNAYRDFRGLRAVIANAREQLHRSGSVLGGDHNLAWLDRERNSGNKFERVRLDPGGLGFRKFDRAANGKRVVVESDGLRESRERRRKRQNGNRRRNQRRPLTRGNTNGKTIGAVLLFGSGGNLPTGGRFDGGGLDGRLHVCDSRLIGKIHGDVERFPGNQFMAVGVDGDGERDNIGKGTVDALAHVIEFEKSLSFFLWRLTSACLRRNFLAKSGNLLAGFGDGVRGRGAIERELLFHGSG